MAFAEPGTPGHLATKREDGGAWLGNRLARSYQPELTHRRALLLARGHGNRPSALRCCKAVDMLQGRGTQARC